MATIISAGELASYLRDPSVTEESAGVILSLANDLVSATVGEDEATTPHPRVTAITYEVAARAWRNPQGLANERIDDYSYGRTPETREAGVYLTASERAELQGMNAPTAGFYTVDLGTPASWT